MIASLRCRSFNNSGCGIFVKKLSTTSRPLLQSLLSITNRPLCPLNQTTTFLATGHIKRFSSVVYNGAKMSKETRNTTEYANFQEVLQTRNFRTLPARLSQLLAIPMKTSDLQQIQTMVASVLTPEEFLKFSSHDKKQLLFGLAILKFSYKMKDHQQLLAAALNDFIITNDDVVLSNPNFDIIKSLYICQVTTEGLSTIRKRKLATKFEFITMDLSLDHLSTVFRAFAQFNIKWNEMSNNLHDILLTNLRRTAYELGNNTAVVTSKASHLSPHLEYQLQYQQHQQLSDQNVRDVASIFIAVPQMGEISLYSKAKLHESLCNIASNALIPPYSTENRNPNSAPITVYRLDSHVALNFASVLTGLSKLRLSYVKEPLREAIIKTVHYVAHCPDYATVAVVLDSFGKLGLDWSVVDPEYRNEIMVAVHKHCEKMPCKNVAMTLRGLITVGFHNLNPSFQADLIRYCKYEMKHSEDRTLASTLQSLSQMKLQWCELTDSARDKIESVLISRLPGMKKQDFTVIKSSLLYMNKSYSGVSYSKELTDILDSPPAGK